MLIYIFIQVGCIIDITRYEQSTSMWMSRNRHTIDNVKSLFVVKVTKLNLMKFELKEIQWWSVFANHIHQIMENYLVKSFFLIFSKNVLNRNMLYIIA